MDNLELIAGAIIIPIAAYLVNVLARVREKMPQSAGADMLMLLVVFDGTVLLSNESFKAFVLKPTWANHIIGFHITALFVCLVCWGVALLLERSVIRAFDFVSETYPQKGKVVFQVMIGWAMVSLSIAAHFVFFAYRT